MGSSSSRTKFDYTIDGVDIFTSESLQFELGTIKNATNNFSPANKMGEGRLGAVYRGVLPDGRVIAVKWLPRITFSRHQLKNEVELLLKIQHRNHVRLLGFCLEDDKGNQRVILIYEFVPNGSLDKYIFDNAEKSCLDWDKRYKIIASIARGLLYAHEDSRTIMIHGDLKASNILLDEEMDAKVADFGIIRLFNICQTEGSSTRMGTIGYMPPEYLVEGLPTEFMSVKADVYSFGVFILEIISGKKITSFHHPTPPHDLLSYAWNCWREGTTIELMDPYLNDSFLRDEVVRSIHIGLLCVQNKAEDRPTMRKVVRMLNNDSDVAGFPLPSQPAFYGSALDRLVDPTLHDNFWEDEVIRCIHIGLLCVQENVQVRPTISLVVGMLNDHSLTLEAPSLPTFCAENSSNMATRETELEDSCTASCSSSPFNPR